MAYKINTIFTASYDSLKNTFKAVQGQFNTMKIQSNNFSQSFKQDMEKMGGATGILDNGIKASAIGIATLSLPMFLAGKGAMSMAGQFEASTQTLEFTLGRAKTIVDDFVSNNATALGMAEQDAYRFANVYSNLLTTMTNDQKTNATMTNKLLQASSVIMSKTGRTFGDVADRIRSGLLGNTEAIEDLGVQVQVSLLESTDAFKQIADGRSWDKLSFKEQQQIRLLGILEQTSKKYGEEVGQNLSLELSKNAAMFKNVQGEASKFLAVGLQPLLGTISNIGNSILIFVKYLNTLDDGTKKTITTFFVIIAVMPIVALVLFTLIKAINSFNVAMATSKIMASIFGKGIIRSVLGSSLLVIAGIGILCMAFGGLGNVVQNIGSIMKIALLTAAAGIVAAIGYIMLGISVLIPGLKGAAESTLGFANSIMGNAKSIAGQVKSMGNATKSTDTASKAMETLSSKNDENTDSAKKASKANKELADNLQGFDEINKLSPDTANAGVGDTAKPGIGPSVDLGGIDTGAFDNIGSQFENLTSKVEGFKKKLQELAPIIALLGIVLIGLGIAKLITDFSMFAGISVGPLLLGLAGISLIVLGISELFNGNLYTGILLITAGLMLLAVAVMLVTGGFSLIPIIIIAIVALIALAVVWICDNWEMIKTFFIGVWNGIKEFFSGIWQWLCDKCSALGEWFKGIFDGIGKFFTDVWNIVKVPFEFVWNLFKTIISNFLSNFKIIFDNIKMIFTAVWNALKDVFAPIWNWIKEKAEYLGAIFALVWETIKTKFEFFWNMITNFFTGIWNWIKEKAEGIGKVFSDVWEGIKNTFSNMWEGLKNIIGSIGTFIGDAVGGTIKAVVNGVLSMIEKAVNGFFGIINAGISGLRNIPGLGGLKHLQLLSLPRLASGGVATKSTIVNIGEYANARSNPEIVSPRNMMYDTVLDANKESNKNTNNNQIKVVEKVVKIEVDMMAGGVRTGKRIIDLLKDTDEFYDLGLEF